MADLDPVGAQALEGCPVQHALELAAMDTDLRHVVAGVEAAGLVPDRLAAMGHVQQTSGANADPVELGQQAERRQLLDGVRQHVDANAELPHLCCLLEDLSLDADLVECKGGGQAADASSRDQYLHGMSVPCGARSIASRRGGSAETDPAKATRAGVCSIR